MQTELLVLGGVVLVAFVIIAVLLMRQSKSGGSAQSGASSPSRSRSSSSAGAAGTAQQVKYNWVIGKSGNIDGKAFHVGERMASIGRGVGNYIQVDDETASQRHALLIGTAHGMQISDMKSSNGTFVNGEELGPNEERFLKNGDEIKMGDTVFIYQQSGAYEDATLTHKKRVDDVEQTKAAMSIADLAGGGKQDLEKQVLVAIQANDGDYQAAAQQLSLDVEILEQIVRKAQSKYDR